MLALIEPVLIIIPVLVGVFTLFVSLDILMNTESTTKFALALTWWLWGIPYILVKMVIGIMDMIAGKKIE